MELLLVKPRVKSLEHDEVNNVEKFEISPLEAGQAIGVFGNSLRTTLLSNIPGYAVTNFQIGYRKSSDEKFVMKTHTFDTISGVTPDMTDISLTIKESLFKLVGVREKDITVSKVGPCTITLADFKDENVIVLNPELEILKIVDNTEVTLTLKVREGRGYKDESFFDMEDWISVDALFSPVKKVCPSVEDVRVNGESGYHKLLLTVETNGKLTPKESLDVAIRIIKEGYNVLSEGIVDVIENESIYFDVQEEESQPVVYKNIGELGLSVRAYNALKSYGINNTGDFERYTEKEIKDFDNLGKKTFDEIKKKLAEYGIELKK